MPPHCDSKDGPVVTGALTALDTGDVNEALRQPELQDRLKKLSAQAFGGSVERTARYLQEEVERWGGVIRSANVRLE